MSFAHAQAFLLLTLLSMMNCAVHQILKISLKIYLLGALSAIYFAVSTLELMHLPSPRLHVFAVDGQRYVCSIHNSIHRECSSSCIACIHRTVAWMAHIQINEI